MFAFVLTFMMRVLDHPVLCLGSKSGHKLFKGFPELVKIILIEDMHSVSVK